MTSEPVTCSICLDDITNDQYVTKCNHVYHGMCINAWIAKSTECPMCRELMPMTFTQRVQTPGFVFFSVNDIINAIIEHECSPDELCTAITRNIINVRDFIVMCRSDWFRRGFLYECLRQGVLDTSTTIMLINEGYLYEFTRDEIIELRDSLSLYVTMYMDTKKFDRIHFRKISKKKSVFSRLVRCMRRLI